ncbi:MAG: phosphatidylinositol-specific phospholipase C/glycerophosphodiester phosphodiesterase family protein [Chitinophagaceae bacterium]
MKKNQFAGTRSLLFFIIPLLFSITLSAQVIHLPNAYAHNDYWHKRPLLDALDNGFTYVEADIYLRHSKLLVAHRPPFLKKKHTIEALYLQPFLNRLAGISLRAQTSLDTIVLMIDIKSRGAKTYAALRKVLNDYKDILSTCDNGKVTIRNLTLVLTGHRPLQLLESEASRFVFADADLRKMQREEFPEMFTTASCKYSNLITWRGKGDIPAFERERLLALVDKAHVAGTKVRLWGSPENETVWLFLRNCGVDLINTDKLLALKHFFIKTAYNRNTSNLF